MRPRALVVDDSLTVRMDLRSTLANAGFLVVACSTKTVAWTTLKGGAFTLAVLDIHLPDGSGIDLLKEIRKDPQTQPLHTILLTTAAEAQARIQGISCGADRYVAKPYDRDYLARVARDLCRMQPLGEPPNSRRALSGKKILVVDDNLAFTSAVADHLRHDGMAVVPARTSDEALALLSVETFACVLLGLMDSGTADLADPGDVDTCRRIRQLPHGRQAPLLAVMACDQPWVRQELLGAGATAVALKSSLELLRMQVHRLLIKPLEEPVRAPVLRSGRAL